MFYPKAQILQTLVNKSYLSGCFRISLLFLIAITSVNTPSAYAIDGGTQIGLSLGYGNYGVLGDDLEKSNFISTANPSICFSIPINRLISIGSGIGYTSRGGKLSETLLFFNRVYVVEYHYALKLNYINIPIVVKYQFKERVAISGGVEVLYLLSAEQSNTTYEIGSLTVAHPFPLSEDLAHKYDVAPMLAIHAKINPSVEVAVSYSFGLRNIYEDYPSYISERTSHGYSIILSVLI